MIDFNDLSTTNYIVADANLVAEALTDKIGRKEDGSFNSFCVFVAGRFTANSVGGNNSKAFFSCTSGTTAGNFPFIMQAGLLNSNSCRNVIKYNDGVSVSNHLNFSDLEYLDGTAFSGYSNGSDSDLIGKKFYRGIAVTGNTGSVGTFWAYLAVDDGNGDYVFTSGSINANIYSRELHNPTQLNLCGQSGSSYSQTFRYQLGFFSINNQFMSFDDFVSIIETNDPSSMNVINSGNFVGPDSHLLSFPYHNVYTDSSERSLVSGEAMSQGSNWWFSYGSGITNMDLVASSGSDSLGTFLNFANTSDVSNIKWRGFKDTYDLYQVPDAIVPGASGSAGVSGYPILREIINDEPSGHRRIMMVGNSRGVRQISEYATTGVALNSAGLSVGDYSALDYEFSGNMSLGEGYAHGMMANRVDNTIGANAPLWNLDRISSYSRRNQIIMDSTVIQGNYASNSNADLNISRTALDQNAHRLSYNNAVNNAEPGPGDTMRIDPNGHMDFWIHNVGKIQSNQDVVMRFYIVGCPETFASQLEYIPLASFTVPNGTKITGVSNSTSGFFDNTIPLVCSGSVISGGIANDDKDCTIFVDYATRSPAIDVGNFVYTSSGTESKIAFNCIATGAYNKPVGADGDFVLEHKFGDPSDSFGGIPENQHIEIADYEIKILEVTLDADEFVFGYQYRGLRLEHTSGNYGAYILGVEAYHPTASGFMWFPAGWGGQGYSRHIRDMFKIDGSGGYTPFQKLLQAYDLDVVFFAGAQQNSDPSSIVQINNVFQDALPDAEYIWSYESIHPSNENAANNDESNWAEYYIENAVANNAVAVHAYDTLGSAIQQWYHGFRETAAHQSSYGMIVTTQKWLELLADNTSAEPVPITESVIARGLNVLNALNALGYITKGD